MTSGSRNGSMAWSPIAVAVVLLVPTGGCANYAAPFQTAPPRPNVPTEVASQLAELPPPEERVVAAVYRFRDQTGQFRQEAQVASFSTAVTQGAASILMRALEDSNWFVPIEREGLSNLLNERQIIQQIRSQYEGPEAQPLPPLLFAGVMLEGGIIGFDTNLITGGAVARYFGAGGSAEFRQDQVTVYLRATSTQTGRVLKTVYTTKTILSQKMDVGVVRFVRPDRLLEAEIGYSFNEPPVVAVTEAIEKAVKSLIIEGVRDGLWSLEDPDDIQHEAFLEYDRASVRAASTDAFDQFAGHDRTGLALGLDLGAQRYQGNFRDPLARPSAGGSLMYMLSPRIGVGAAGSVGQLAAQGAFETTSASGEVRGIYHLLPHHTASPFLVGGVGLLVPDMDDLGTDLGEQVFPYATIGGGVEYLLSPSVGLGVTFRNQYALQDGIDGVKEGSGHDSVWNLTAGLTLYR